MQCSSRAVYAVQRGNDPKTPRSGTWGGARCLLRLSPDDLQSRFLGSVGDDFIVAPSDALFAPGAIILGCFIRGALCAVGELHQQVTVRIAEIAIRVEPAFQLRPWKPRYCGGWL